MSCEDFREIGTDGGDLNDENDPCLAAGIGGFIGDLLTSDLKSTVAGSLLGKFGFS